MPLLNNLQEVMLGMAKVVVRKKHNCSEVACSGVVAWTVNKSTQLMNDLTPAQQQTLCTHANKVSGNQPSVAAIRRRR